MYFWIQLDYTLISVPCATLEEARDVRKTLRQDLEWILVKKV